MSHCLTLRPPLPHHLKSVSIRYEKPSKLVAEVEEKLEKEHYSLPVGKYGRDDEELILWYLIDRKYCVEDTVSKLTKAISRRKDFRVSELSEESVKCVAETGKGYLHNHLDVHDRPVLIVESSKHFPGEHELYEDKKLFIFLVEKALSTFPAGKQEILVIIDLRGFQTRNVDLDFLMFVFDTFYYCYPKQLGQVLFVDAPFVFKPFWQVRFCTAEDVKGEYFTENAVPANFTD